MDENSQVNPHTALVETSCRGGRDKFSPEQQEEIKFFVRRMIYADFNVTPAIVILALSQNGHDLSRQLVQHYIAQVQKEDAEAERVRHEAPDLVLIRTVHRKHREAVFNSSMKCRQFAQANRALDALAALDGVAVSKSTVALEGKNGGPVQIEDVTQMSDAALRQQLAAVRERKAAQAETAPAETAPAETAPAETAPAETAPDAD